MLTPWRCSILMMSSAPFSFMEALLIRIAPCGGGSAGRARSAKPPPAIAPAGVSKVTCSSPLRRYGLGNDDYDDEDEPKDLGIENKVVVRVGGEHRAAKIH